MKISKEEMEPPDYAKRFWKGLLIQVKCSIWSSMIAVCLVGIYTIFEYRFAILERPVGFFVDLAIASWVLIPAFLFALIFTAPVPFVFLFLRRRSLKIVLIALYQFCWFLFGLVSVFYWGMREPSTEASISMLMIMALCIIFTLFQMIDRGKIRK